MAKTDNLPDFLTEIANAIRHKKGTTDLINAQDFASEIDKMVLPEEPTTGRYVCRVIDYDGTVIKEEHLDTGDIFTLPDAPVHDGLTFEGWRAPVEIVNNRITVDGNDVICGAGYTTTSGLSEFDIVLTPTTGLDVVLSIEGTKNWGDGTTDTATTHTYSSYGSYTITTTGTATNTTTSYGLFGQSSSTNNYYCTAARLGSSVTKITAGAFAYCRSLKYVAIPESAVTLGHSIFNSSDNLVCATLPSAITTIPMSTFGGCYSMENVVLSYGLTMIDSSAFGGLPISNISIPDSVTTIDTNIFLSSNMILTSVVIPANCASIARYGIWCNSILKYDFTKLSHVPTLADTAESPYINRLAKIIVPDRLYDEWIAATNWTLYEYYIYKASEVTD